MDRALVQIWSVSLGIKYKSELCGLGVGSR